MLIDVCLGTRTVWKILLVFAESPGKAISRKEIQKLTKLGNKVLTHSLIILEKFQMIFIKKMGKEYYYTFNLSGPFAEPILTVIQTEKKELNNPPFVVLNILREFVYRLTTLNFKNLNSIFLFGSYAKRTYTTGSDIDVAIILQERNISDELMITEIISQLKERFHKEIQPHYFTLVEWGLLKRKEGLAKEIITSGIKLL